MIKQVVRWVLTEQARWWRDEGVARAMRKRIPILRPACRLDVMQPMAQISQSSIDIARWRAGCARGLPRQGGSRDLHIYLVHGHVPRSDAVDVVRSGSARARLRR